MARPLFTCHSLLVATPAYLAKHGTIHSPQELANHRYLAHANVNRKEWTFIKDGQETVLELTSQLTINDTGALLNFTLADGGIAMLPNILLNSNSKQSTTNCATRLANADLSSIRRLSLPPPTLPSGTQLCGFLVEEFEGRGLVGERESAVDL
ncbi:putative HTH-type transcriptional regulator [Actinobacillus equuli]|nr:putative HTH-type transcriptional regulator [Actinobacillus equuli]